MQPSHAKTDNLNYLNTLNRPDDFFKKNTNAF